MDEAFSIAPITHMTDVRDGQMDNMSFVYNKNSRNFTNT